MKQIYILTGIFLFITTFSYSQTWNGDYTTITGSIYRTGNIGIGTTAPRGGLDVSTGNIWLTSSGISSDNDLYASGHIYLIPRSSGISYIQSRRSDNSGSTQLQLRTWNNGSMTEAIRITSDGKVGIGTTAPRGGLDVSTGNIWLTSSGFSADNDLYAPGHIYLIPRSSGISYIQSRRSDNSGSTQLQLRTWYNGSETEAIRITSDGKVGIGTTAPTAKLTVKGDILASKVEIKNDSEIPASDYVFDQDYNLRSLKDVEQFVKVNKHLPEVPSAKEFKENGYSVGEMDDILLRKVEELTLYIIDQQKTIEQLKNKVEQLEKGE